ncbi:hypothetical protein E5344_10795 [Microbacterium laevaniformans]|uniref:Uncharacterized protein n=1 Tax=Microbacterium laevaniformans TaxID=36807 RepID=A0A4V3RJK5_9MICO|nr:hypothetical protein CEP17_11160 [Microbacterium sp. PM5]TGY36250.1 hypothetical protein E5344_10795 [Microbacterium laevaniformans]
MRWSTAVAELRRAGVGATIALAMILTLTGCSGMNENAVSERLTQASGINGAMVEVQHPGAPWVNKIVIRLFVRDASAAAVADDVRAVAAFAVDDRDLGGQPLTLLAVQGSPGDFSDPLTATITDSAYVMGSVSEILGAGKGVENILDLSAADVSRIAQR